MTSGTPGPAPDAGTVGRMRSSAAGPSGSLPASSAVLVAGTGDGVVMGISGELDRDAAERLRATLEDAIAPGAVVTLDLARVTHLSQAALAVVVQAHRRLRDSGGSLRLTSVSEPVVRVLRISGLHRVFDVESEAERASDEPVPRAAGA